MKRRTQAVWCGIVAAAMAGGVSADAPSRTYQLPPNSEVISYLLQSVNWYRHDCAERQVANETTDFMFLDDNLAIERHIVKLSFEFAKADAVLEATVASSHRAATSADALPADVARFIELKNRNDELSQQAMQETQDLDKRLNRAKGTDAKKLQAAKEDVQTRL